MKLLIEIKMVYRGLVSRKGRSFLTILGIVIGVAGVITIISLGAGAQSLVVSQLTSLGSNLIGILPGKSDETGPPASVFGVQITTLTMSDIEALQDKVRFPHITAVAPFVNGTAVVVWNNKSIDTTFSGTLGSLPDVQTLPIARGRFMTEEEARAGGNVLVLGWDVNELLFGEADALGKVVKVNNVPCQVIGVTAKQGTVAFQNQDDIVYIPLPIAQKQMLGINYLQFARAKIDKPEFVKSTIAEVETLLKERHRIKSDDQIDFSVRDIADALKLITGITDGLRLFLSAMAGIALVVGGIGIMNIMLVTVAERTREIGLRKAVGATKSNIRNQFLLESAVVTLLGGLIGIVFGSLLSYAIALGARFAGYSWDFIISPIAVLLAIGVSILTGLIFGLYPAFKASKLNPIDALRYE